MQALLWQRVHSIPVKSVVRHHSAVAARGHRAIDRLIGGARPHNFMASQPGRTVQLMCLGQQRDHV